MNWLVRQAADTENYMNSVERTKFYTNEIPQEKADIIPSHRPDSKWPQEGVVSIKNLVMKYRENLPAVLNDISLDIRRTEKIGVVGRTGAGKSSLMIALFRLVEASSGSITIDGVDISTIGLYDLRSKLAIIPQDPVLYSGTVRSNLDPFGDHNDDDLWQVLERSQLKNAIQALDMKLDALVNENGENFSWDRGVKYVLLELC